MNEIKCPHCSKAFKVDETGYANILKQVYDHEFENQLNERLTQKEREKASELKLAKMDADSAIQTLKAEKEVEIERLRSTIREKDISVQATVDKAVREMEKERDNLKNDLKNSILEKENSENLLKDKYKTQYKEHKVELQHQKHH